MDMKKVLIALSALAVVACSTEPKDNTLTKAEKADGWELLFDGQTLNGWRSFNEPALVGESWVVEDGTIAATGKGDDAHGYIVTDRVAPGTPFPLAPARSTRSLTIRNLRK